MSNKVESWQYQLIKLEPMTGFQIEDLPNREGMFGWELCCSEYGFLIMKRRRR